MSDGDNRNFQTWQWSMMTRGIKETAHCYVSPLHLPNKKVKYSVQRNKNGTKLNTFWFDYNFGYKSKAFQSLWFAFLKIKLHRICLEDKKSKLSSLLWYVYLLLHKNIFFFGYTMNEQKINITTWQCHPVSSSSWWQKCC